MIFNARSGFLCLLAVLCAIPSFGLQAGLKVAGDPQGNGAPQTHHAIFVLPAGVAVERELVYTSGGSTPETLDLYRPASGAGPFPGVVFIHGGAWAIGSKADFQRQAAYLATQGYVCVSINYRLSQEAPYPAALYDAKAAVRWMRANAQKYGVDPNRIAAAGGSAGGQLAALLGTTASFKTMEGDRGNAQYSSRVEAVVAFNPLTDFVSAMEKTSSPAAVTRAVVPFLGGSLEKVPETYVEASPVAHVSTTSAPFLLLHGTADTTLPFSQSVEMRDALQAVGVRAELYSAENANHGFFNRPPFYEPALERMKAFLDSVLK
jgi:acetyl esterase/lipase